MGIKTALIVLRKRAYKGASKLRGGIGGIDDLGDLGILDILGILGA